MCSRIASQSSSRRVRAPRAGGDNSRGSVTGFVVCSVAMLIACAGIAFDGGRYVAAYVHASDLAANAARAGTQVVVGIRAGNPQINTAGAREQAQRFLASAGATGTIRVDTEQVEVRVTTVVRMKILAVFGVADKVVTVTRTASPFMG